MRLTSSPVVARVKKLRVRWREERRQTIQAFRHDDEQTMNTVRVRKDKLLKILKKNRIEHKEIFEEASKTYRQNVLEALDTLRTKVIGGSPFDVGVFCKMEPPKDHTAEYDRAIEMLTMSVDAAVTITEREFQRLVQDIWDWSSEWASNSLSYVSRNSRNYGKLSALASLD